jgi:hypothetical protein
MDLEEDAAGPSRNTECLYHTNGVITQETNLKKTAFLAMKWSLIDTWVKAGW